MTARSASGSQPRARALSDGGSGAAPPPPQPYLHNCFVYFCPDAAAAAGATPIAAPTTVTSTPWSPGSAAASPPSELAIAVAAGAGILTGLPTDVEAPPPAGFTVFAVGSPAAAFHAREALVASGVDVAPEVCFVRPGYLTACDKAGRRLPSSDWVVFRRSSPSKSASAIGGDVASGTFGDDDGATDGGFEGGFGGEGDMSAAAALAARARDL